MMRKIVFLLFVLMTQYAQAKLVEENFTIQVKVRDLYNKEHSHALQTWLIYDETTPSPRPVAILGHGRASKPEQRINLDVRSSFLGAARWLARQGFVGVAFARIGYGQTGGEDIDQSGKCSNPNFPSVYEVSAQQMEQVLAAVRNRSDVHKERGILLGQSFGGATVVALAAKNPNGIQAVFNFAGGGGGRPDTHPEDPCGEFVMRKMLGDFGKTSRLPTFWGYTENDLYWGSKNPKNWFNAFKANGGVGEYVLFPAHGKDGHSLFYQAPEVWRPKMAEFLRVNGYPGVNP